MLIVQYIMMRLRYIGVTCSVSKLFFMCIGMPGSCEIVQSGLCIFYGITVESFDLPSMEDCEVGFFSKYSFFLAEQFLSRGSLLLQTLFFLALREYWGSLSVNIL
jgi:hypothetical protein